MDYEEEHEEEEEELEGLPTAYDHHHQQLGNNNSSPAPTMPPLPGRPTPAGSHNAVSGAGRKSMGSTPGVRYRECLKNHAVGIGGHAVDGCGEFMAAGEEGTLDVLKCAACTCHRNFHRKETDGEPASSSAALAAAAASAYGHGPFSPYYRTPAGYLHVAQHHRPPPTLTLPSTSGGGGGGGAAHSRDDQEDVSNPSSGGGAAPAATPTGESGKKRFRTKFTLEQKEKMLALAERLGWRIQKQDEAAVQQFCAETGVKRHVLKVWMHNNKHTLGKKP